MGTSSPATLFALALGGLVMGAAATVFRAPSGAAGRSVEGEARVVTADGVGLHYRVRGTRSRTDMVPLASLHGDRLDDPLNRGLSETADPSAVSPHRQLDDVEAVRRAVGAERRDRVAPAIEAFLDGEWPEGARSLRRGRAPDRSGGTAAGREPERVAPGVVSTPGGEAFPALEPDGDVLWFSTHDESWSHHQIVFSRSVGGEWQAPEVAPFSGGSWSDRAPRFSPDGRRLYFASNRPRPGETEHDARDYDLWMVERDADGGLGEPQLMPEPISTASPEYHPSVAASGALYFASFGRPGGAGRSDLYRGRRDGDVWSVESLGARVNSPQSEPDVWVDPDERFLVVTSTDRPEGLGHDDLYLSVREGDGWSPLVHLGSPVSSEAFEYGATVSPDGRWLWFTSHREGSADIFRIETAALPELARALADARTGS